MVLQGPTKGPSPAHIRANIVFSSRKSVNKVDSYFVRHHPASLHTTLDCDYLLSLNFGRHPPS